MLAQGWCIRQSTDADAEAICALMRRAFDYGDGSNAALNLAWWRWKLRAPRTSSVDARLLPVVVKQAEARFESLIELRVRDVTVRIAGGADVAYVAALVDALRG